MALLRKTFVLGCALCGIVTASQAPEFAQQYRQRLGGAVAELQTVVKDFDRDAASSGLQRHDALVSMKTSDNTFSQNRGQSMGATIARFEVLQTQQTEMEYSNPLMRQWIMVENADPKIVSEAWQDFEPAIPLTTPGLIWAIIGALLLGGPGWLLASLVGRGRASISSDFQIPKAVRSNLSAPRIQIDHHGYGG